MLISEKVLRDLFRVVALPLHTVPAGGSAGHPSEQLALMGSHAPGPVPVNLQPFPQVVQQHVVMEQALDMGLSRPAKVSCLLQVSAWSHAWASMCWGVCVCRIYHESTGYTSLTRCSVGGGRAAKAMRGAVNGFQGNHGKPHLLQAYQLFPWD